ncbi:uncharacterized protein LOC125814012 [Solanum verrucosum]|uniref:uncharacterized protein LOC125814012 n=1 Tax=Solanum verrucosum TaxID=315347 RepID=UPI0020D091FB|nr:uncharacterized protein LOC125814012 [Solanum verrucosum]
MAPDNVAVDLAQNLNISQNVGTSAHNNGSSSSNQGIDYNHPLFLSPTYISGINARSQILMMNPLPSINHEYAMIMGDESQKAVVHTSSSSLGLSAMNMESFALYYKVRSSSGVSQRFKKNSLLVCDFCNYKGHINEFCYKIVGYPPDFKSKKKSQGSESGQYSQPSVAQAHFSYGSNTNVQVPEWGKKVENSPYHNFGGESIAENTKANMQLSQSEKDGKQLLQGARSQRISKAFFVSANNKVWIIDTGATNHMVSNLEMLSKNSVTKLYTLKIVYLPNGDTTKVTHELYTEKVKEVGKEEGGLYLLLSQLTHGTESEVKKSVWAVPRVLSSIELWHQRLGHVFSIVLARMFDMNKDSMCKTQFGKTVKMVRSDIGTEFLNSVCNTMFKDLGIIHQRSCPYTPQQISVAERKHRHIRDVTRALRFEAKIPLTFWGHCVLAAVYLINKLPSSVIDHRLLIRDCMGAHQVKINCSYEIFRSSEGEKENSLNTHIVFEDTVQGLCVLYEDFNQFSHMPEVEQVQNGSAQVIDTTVCDSTQDVVQAPTRRSTRTTHTPKWMRDFVSLNISKDVQYPLCNYMSYDHLSPSYKCYIDATSTVQEHVSYADTIKDKRWVEAMQIGIHALETNNTWVLTDLPIEKKPIGYRWIYKVKYQSTGEIERFKGRLVAKGYSQQEGIDYQETFSPVVKMVTVRTIVALAASRQWHIHQIDVFNAFLHGDLEDEIYMQLPQGFIIITGSSLKMIEETKKSLQQAFKMKDLGELKYFLGIEFIMSADVILMHQRKYPLKLITEVGLSAVRPAGTPIDINVKLTSKLYDDHIHKGQEEDPLVDVTMYHMLIGKLLYLNMTRPDISFSTQTLRQFLQQP